MHCFPYSVRWSACGNFGIDVNSIMSPSYACIEGCLGRTLYYGKTCKSRPFVSICAFSLRAEQFAWCISSFFQLITIANQHMLFNFLHFDIFNLIMVVIIFSISNWVSWRLKQTYLPILVLKLSFHKTTNIETIYEEPLLLYHKYGCPANHNSIVKAVIIIIIIIEY